MDLSEGELSALFLRGFEQYYNIFCLSHPLDTFNPPALPNANDIEQSYLAVPLASSEALKVLHAKDPNAVKDLVVDHLICCFHTIDCVVRCHALFSTNEELEDIRTEHLKYLLVQFILGRLCAETAKWKLRPFRLQQALSLCEGFMGTVGRLGACRKEDLEVWQQEAKFDPATERAKRIERAKYEKEISDRIQAMLAKMKKCPGDDSLWFAGEESAEREFFLALLKRSAVECITEIDLIKQELPLIERRLQEEISQSNSGIANAESERGFPPPQKPWSCHIKKPEDLRGLYLSQVFRPGHELPSISLAECAEMEMKMEVGALGGGIKKEAVKEFNEAEYSAKEEEEEQKAREWDDWKDEHPKGIGNKMKNTG